MTRRPNNKPAAKGDPSVLAVLHEAGRDWRGVIVRRPAGRGVPTLLDAATFGPGDPAAIGRWLDEHSAGRVTCVLPAADAICRTFALPDAPADQLLPALTLQAEAHLLGIAPPHRLGMAVLDDAPGETGRLGIVAAWPESVAVEAIDLDHQTTYAPVVGAIAALLNGTRPDEPLLWLDRRGGAIAMALSHADGVTLRAARENATSDEAWETGVRRAVAETAINDGHAPEVVQSLVETVLAEARGLDENGTHLMLPAEVVESAAARLEGATRDAAWWRTYGLAAGVAMAACGTLAPLTELERAAPVEHPSIAERLTSMLSTRRFATNAIIVAVALILFGWPVFSFLHLQALRLRYPEETLEKQIELVERTDKTIDMYRGLQKHTWSTTKLLSDIVGTAPMGIDLDQIRLDESGFTLRGTVRAEGGRTEHDILLDFAGRIANTGIFEKVAYTRHEGTMSGSDFDMSADVADPHRPFRPPAEEDYAINTHRVRLYGEKPEWIDGDGDGDDAATALVAGTAPPPAATIDEPDDEGDLDDGAPLADARDAGEEIDLDEDDGGRDRRRPRDSGSFDAGSSILDRGEETGADALGEVPPPLSDAAIATMSRAETIQALKDVAMPMTRFKDRLDDETMERLREEKRKLMDHLHALRREQQ